MSYCRFVEGDVYVYGSITGGLDCCGCLLQEREFVEEPGSFFGFHLNAVEPILRTQRLSTDEMIAHLNDHIAAGHRVPDHVIPAIEADRAENDATLG